MKKIVSIVVLSFFITNGNTQPLPKDSPEIMQLIAMGYEIDKDYEKEYKVTLATTSNSKILLSKNSDRLAAFRVFTRTKKLDKNTEFELHKIVNELNTEYSYQVAIDETSISFTLYDYGSYNPKTFSKIVRMMERVDGAFNKNSKLLGLLN